MESASQNITAGLKHHAAGRLAEAEEIYRQILVESPDDPDATHFLGVVAFQKSQFQDAIDLIERAIQHNPSWPEALHNLGLAYFKSGDYERAIDSFRRAIAIKPTFVEPLVGLADACREIERRFEAIEAYQRAITLRPGHVQALTGLAAVLGEVGENDQRIAWLERAVAANPNDFKAIYDLSVALEAAGGTSEAAEALKRAFELDPGKTHFERAMVLLRNGNLADGWREYDRYRHHWLKQIGLPKWNGEHLPGGTILLISDEGFGDGIHWVRYAAMVRARVGRVIVACQPELVSLFKSMPEIDEVAASPAGPFDTHSILSRLNFVFRTTVETIPGKVPYLFAAPDAVSRWRLRVDPIAAAKLRVGLVWAGGTANAQADRMRSVKLEAFAPLFALENIAFFSVQKGEGARQIRSSAHNIVHLGDEIGDFADTAAVLANLDLLISVDTSVAHLAGAIAMPVWTLIQAYCSDFRWLLDREDSPWYPTMRLFRQKKTAEWTPVIERIAAELKQLANAKSHSHQRSQFPRHQQ